MIPYFVYLNIMYLSVPFSVLTWQLLHGLIVLFIKYDMTDFLSLIIEPNKSKQYLTLPNPTLMWSHAQRRCSINIWLNV